VIPLTADEKFLCVLISVSGGFGVILPIIGTARSKAGRINEEYLRDSLELFGEPSPIGLVSWLLDPQPTSKRRRRTTRGPTPPGPSS
jgi:hypothetical protein